MICCICKNEIKEGYGNNPYGVLYENGQPVPWRPEDVCCNDCNLRYVIPGRIFMKLNDSKYSQI